MYIIGITGGTASGKTTFVNLLKQRFSDSEVVIISQDEYYNPLSHLSIQEREQTNFDHPNSIDFKLFHEHITALKAGNSIEIPNYCFTTHDRLANTTTVTPKKVLIIEGILILSQAEIKNSCDYTLFIDAPHEIRVQRRLKRDVNERGRTPESVMEQFTKNIAPMHKAYVTPVKSTVNLIIDGTQEMESNVRKISSLINQQLS